MHAGPLISFFWSVCIFKVAKQVWWGSWRDESAFQCSCFEPSFPRCNQINNTFVFFICLFSNVWHIVRLKDDQSISIFTYFMLFWAEFQRRNTFIVNACWVAYPLKFFTRTSHWCLLHSAFCPVNGNRFYHWIICRWILPHFSMKDELVPCHTSNQLTCLFLLTL